MVIDVLQKLIGILVVESQKRSLITENGAGVIQSSSSKKNCPSGIGLRALSSFLRIVFSCSAPQLRDRVNRCYKIYIEREPNKLANNVNGSQTVERSHQKAKIINVWCFSAAFGWVTYFLYLSSGEKASMKN